jgi:hypothetical protein
VFQVFAELHFVQTWSGKPAHTPPCRIHRPAENPNKRWKYGFFYFLKLETAAFYLSKMNPA